MTVLSLFDGMSCGQIALRQLGIIPYKYYASEIDLHAIRQTQNVFPDTIQLGNVENWREWKIDWASIDLVLAGSPCQGFSFAGKQLAFDDPRSRLFFVFIDILNYIRKFNPDVKFMLENVKMKKQHVAIISHYCGVFPVMINSALVSAQNRERYYWSNIRTKRVGLFNELHTDIPQPPDKEIIIADILEPEDSIPHKYYLSEAVINRAVRTHKNYLPRINPEKSDSLTTGNNSSKMAFNSGTTFISVVGKSRTLRAKSGFTASSKHNHNIIQLNPNTESGGTQPYQQNRIYDDCGKSPALMAQMSSGTHAIIQRPRGYNKGSVHSEKAPTLSANAWQQNNLLQAGNIRRLTPRECARLQTVPEWYQFQCSDTQAYRMLGNGWTIDIIEWILSFLPSLNRITHIHEYSKKQQ